MGCLCCVSHLFINTGFLSIGLDLAKIFHLQLDIITRPCPNFNIKLRHGWVITSHIKPWVTLLIHALIPVNTLRLRQNCCHSADDIFKCIFVNENVWILLKIWLKFVPKAQIDNIPALVQIMTTSHYLNQCCFVYWCNASLGLNELI